jgi:hypothetical protein
MKTKTVLFCTLILFIFVGCQKTDEGEKLNAHMKFINLTSMMAVVESDHGTTVEVPAHDTVNLFDGHGSTSIFGSTYEVYTVRVGRVHYEYSATVTYVNYINFIPSE